MSVLLTMSDYLKVDRSQLLPMSFAGYVTFQAINQPPFLVPGQSERIRRPILNLERPPNAYYGIGGTSETFRTFVSILGLAKYKSEVQRWTDVYPDAVLYDAYPYDFLNQIDGYKQLRDIWKTFRNLLESKRDEIDARTSKRMGIFRRMAGIANTQIKYVGIKLLEDPQYEEILLELLDKPSLPAWRSLVPVSRRDNPASWLYVPMEIAEALTLKRRFGIKLKVGDRKERGFDNLIYRADGDWLFAYTPSSVTANGERASYRADDINFDMTASEVRNFLDKSPQEVKLQFTWLLQELGRSSGDLIEDTIDVFSEIKGEDSV